MGDNLTTEQRKKNMKAIKSVSKLEEIVSKSLWNKGIRFRRNVKNLYGSPDIAIKKYKIVIFIDSCFWHVCPIHGNFPKNNEKFWRNKLERNKERDQEVNDYYIENNWTLIRVWEHEVKEDLESVTSYLANEIRQEKHRYSLN